MKKLVVLSGKGGTGKTTVAVALARLASQSREIVLADADVDASNVELLVEARVACEHEFVSGEVAVVEAARCTGCGLCVDRCRFDALECDPPARVDPTACEGCRACALACPEAAIEMVPLAVGRWMRSNTRMGTLFHAELHSGCENSGKLVTAIRRESEAWGRAHGAELTIVDGPPGIGCPVLAAATGCDLVLFVAEPTRSGLEDVKRAMDTIETFGLPGLLCINRWDVNPEISDALERAARQRGVDTVARIPFDASVVEATNARRAITEVGGARVSRPLQDLWHAILRRLTLERDPRAADCVPRRV